MKAFKVTISGSYHTSNKDIIDFENVVGYVPYCDQDVAIMHLRARHAAMWVSQNKEKYPDRVHNMREVHIDEMEEIKDHKFDYIGKDIREMKFEDLQDLALAKDLRSVPRFKVGSVHEARKIAYASYWNDVYKGEYIDHRQADFNLRNYDPIIVDDTTRRDLTQKLTNEEVLDRETKNNSTKARDPKGITIEELKDIAKEKGISYHPSIGFNALYTKIYGAE